MTDTEQAPRQARPAPAGAPRAAATLNPAAPRAAQSAPEVTATALPPPAQLAANTLEVVAQTPIAAEAAANASEVVAQAPIAAEATRAAGLPAPEIANTPEPQLGLVESVVELSSRLSRRLSTTIIQTFEAPSTIPEDEGAVPAAEPALSPCPAPAPEELEPRRTLVAHAEALRGDGAKKALREDGAKRKQEQPSPARNVCFEGQHSSAVRAAAKLPLEECSCASEWESLGGVDARRMTASPGAAPQGERSLEEQSSPVRRATGSWRRRAEEVRKVSADIMRKASISPGSPSRRRSTMLLGRQRTRRLGTDTKALQQHMNLSIARVMSRTRWATRITVAVGVCMTIAGGLMLLAQRLSVDNWFASSSRSGWGGLLFYGGVVLCELVSALKWERAREGRSPRPLVPPRASCRPARCRRCPASLPWRAHMARVRHVTRMRMSVAAQGVFLVVVWIRPVHKVASFLLPVVAAGLALGAFVLQLGALEYEFGWTPTDCRGGPACAVDVTFTWMLAVLALIAFFYYACACLDSLESPPEDALSARVGTV
jgi:hypothetical protein